MTLKVHRLFPHDALTTDPIRARSASRSTSGNTEWTSPFRHGHSFSRCTSCSRTRDTISKIFAECASARCLTRRTICPPLRRRCHMHSILSRESAATDRTHTRLTTARQDSGTAGYAARRVYQESCVTPRRDVRTTNYGMLRSQESCVDPSQRRPNHQLRHGLAYYRRMMSYPARRSCVSMYLYWTINDCPRPVDHTARRVL